MNRNQLKYFVAAAETRSFTKAAEQYYISQTAVTQQIRLLEEALGCPLFDRSTRPVSLTPAGCQGHSGADEPGSGAGPRCLHRPQRHAAGGVCPGL